MRLYTWFFIGGQTTIVGSVDGAPGTSSLTIELFGNAVARLLDTRRRQDAHRYCAAHPKAATVMAASHPLPIGSSGLFITGTATNQNNSASEFSNCVAVIGG